jgi:hypothetical protein
MQIDPALEWQRLAGEYRQKTSEELVELARDFADLTETAQQVLSAEMKSRGLGDPKSPRFSPASPQASAQPPLALNNAPWEGDPVDAAFGTFGARTPQPVPDAPDVSDEDAAAHEYTWKTPLCDCETREEATQLQELLRRAGIESWVNFDGSTTPFVPAIQQGLATGGLRILVAADQLDQAQAIAAQPIPQEIVDESKEEVPEFVEPKCPKCGSDDVVLEAVDPENTWRCEQCDAQWTETLPTTPDAAPNAAGNAP